MPTLTNEQKRVAIAKLCGWRCVMELKGVWKGYSPTSKTEHFRLLPDYLVSLDAMAQAEATLSDEELDQYPHHFHTGKGNLYTQFLRMTAAQRADAFLKVKGIL